MSPARRAAIVGACLLGLLVTARAPAQDHPVMSAVWPPDLAAPAGETWVSTLSDGPEKAWLRLWVRALNVRRPASPIEARFAYPPTASIVKVTIDAQGRPKALALVRSSGMTAFDDFVLHSLAGIASTLPPPAGILGDRPTVDVVVQFEAGYSTHSEDGQRLFGMPHAIADAPARPYDAAAWRQFEQALTARVREDLRAHLPPPRTPVDLLLMFSYGDGVIDSVKIGRSTADPAFDELALARARAVAAEFKLPDRNPIGLGIPLHFDAAASEPH